MRSTLLVFALLAGCGSTATVDGGDAATDAVSLDALTDLGTSADARPGDAGSDAPAVTPAPWKGPWSLRMDTTSVALRWETRIMPPDTNVEFAPESGGAARTVAATSTSAMVTAGLNNALVREPDLTGVFYLHEAVLTGLAPNTCYRYHVAAYPDAAGRVCTAHEATDHATPVRFMAIGDTNPTLGHTESTIAAVLARNPEFVVHAGDMQYYSSITETWQTWFRLMAPMLRAGALQPCVGNHENELGGLEYVDYYQRLFAPAGSDGDDVRYHFQSGGVHFFSLSTEDPLGDGSSQRAWLEAALARAAAAPGYRFAVLLFHRPMYTLGDSAPRLDLRASLGPLMATYHVRLVIVGHMHGYERFEVGDVTHVTTAGGGGVIGNVDMNVNTYPDDRPLRVASGSYYHAMLFTIDATTLHGEAIDEAGVVRDTFDHAVP